MPLSWMAKHSECGACRYPVVVTQPTAESYDDYRWYCSNPDCANHNEKTETGDMEQPDWVIDKAEPAA